MPYYRRKKDSDTWHWCRNCEDDPKENYVEEWHPDKERPTTGELDDECLAKEKKNDCQT
jgi:hypothetical protein